MKRFFEIYSPKLLIVWILVLSILYSTLSIVRHARFESGGFDLGLYDQAVWQYSKFLPTYNTIKERTILGDHLTLTLPLLAPLYWIWDDVRILLIFQAFWISASSFAIYLLAKRRKFSSFTALAISFLYSLFYGVQSAIFFDFHPAVLGAGFLAWFVYFFESKKNLPAIVMLILALFTQENMGLALASIGLIYLFGKEYRAQARWLIGIGMAVSFAQVKIISIISPVGYEHWPPDFSWNPTEIVKRYFDDSDKLRVWLYSFSWFSFLPALSPGAVAAVLLDLVQYFHTGIDKARMWGPLTHHRIILDLLLTLGTLDVFTFIKKRKLSIEKVSFFVLLVALGSQYVFHFPLNKLIKKEFWASEPWMMNDRKLIATIPPDVSIATQQNLAPHISHRQFIYLVWPRQHDITPSPCPQKSCWWLDFDTHAAFLLVDLRPNQWLTQILETNEHFDEAVRNMEHAGAISLVRSVGDAKLYSVTKAKL
ncbi:DUF2079 domain-containing protein [Candidatus Gottesmanbacteria bacterium]|nr:DUF2079 domain-containing protein [Candidatus Gottesmanbacteria bacterium]